MQTPDNKKRQFEQIGYRTTAMNGKLNFNRVKRQRGDGDFFDLAS